ncbi:uncharacterized protein LOC142324940 isoform X2 [Lycorma delicatula]|uniref:uncharacterized protein LOC142324940 isoform X2 n=1 Tax=Lycorma delicatula TaxID=130591 RepID=UPI003F515EC8
MNDLISTADAQLFINKWKDIIEKDKAELHNKVKQLKEAQTSSNMSRREITQNSEELEKQQGEDKENFDTVQTSNNNSLVDSRKPTTEDNRNMISFPLKSNNNTNLLHTSQEQKQEDTHNIRNKKLKKKIVIPINSREVEKDLLASIFEKSPLIIGDKSSVKVFQVKNSSNNNKSNFKELGKVITLPLVSERQKEIDRLAELFENSEPSCVRTNDQLMLNVDEEQHRPDYSHASVTNNRMTTEQVQPPQSTMTTVSPDMNYYPVLSSSALAFDVKKKELMEERKKDYFDYMHKDEEQHRPDYSHASVTNNRMTTEQVQPPQSTMTTVSPDMNYYPVLSSSALAFDVKKKELMEERKKDYFDYMHKDEEQHRPDYSHASVTNNRMTTEQVQPPQSTMTTVSSDMNYPDFSSSALAFDGKRKQLMEERKKDYFDYMHKARLQMRNTRPVACSCSHHASLRDAATQTDLGTYNSNNPGYEDSSLQRPKVLMDSNSEYFTNRDKMKSSRGTCTSIPVSPAHSASSSCRSPNRSSRGRDIHKSADCFPSSPYLSPETTLAEKTNMAESCVIEGHVPNTHVKQYIYREELKKQIEERQRLEAERKEKEKHEEEAIERRFREQQEKLRRQYEMEEAQRLEYIMRRHVPDDHRRQRLTDSGVTAASLYNNNSYNRQRPTVLPCSNMATPYLSPDDRPLPLPDKKDKQQQQLRSTTANPVTMTTTNTTTTTTEQQGAIVLNKSAKPINLNRSNSNSNNDSNRQIDPLIGVDLLADNDIEETVDFDNNNGNNDETITQDNFAVNDSSSPVAPAVKTTFRACNNTQILQDKWQTPAVEKTYIRPATLYNRQQLNNINTGEMHTEATSYSLNDNPYSYDVYSARSDNVLTQLGSFRRQLQLQHLKMQERLYHQQHNNSVRNQNKQNNAKATTVTTSRS